MNLYEELKDSTNFIQDDIYSNCIDDHIYDLLDVSTQGEHER